MKYFIPKGGRRGDHISKGKEKDPETLQRDVRTCLKWPKLERQIIMKWRQSEKLKKTCVYWPWMDVESIWKLLQQTVSERILDDRRRREWRVGERKGQGEKRREGEKEKPKKRN